MEDVAVTRSHSEPSVVSSQERERLQHLGLGRVVFGNGGSGNLLAAAAV